MIYLDNGATSYPKPKGMLREMNRCISRYCGNPGRSGHAMSMKTAEKIYETRNDLAKLLNIKDPSRIIFTSNTTEALNIGIKGSLNKGDHVITTTMEHNSVLRPLKTLESQGVETTLIKCSKEGCLDLKELEKEIKENTKLIICTHSSNVTGTIMPINEIGKLAARKGLLFMVDGAQSGGNLPIDTEDINLHMLAMPGHKGLLGPMGTGFLYVKEGTQLNTLMEGGTGTNSKELSQPMDLPERYESGTLNAPGIIGLGYSAKLIREIGVENIRLHEHELIKVLGDALRDMKNVRVYGPKDCNKKTGVLAFNINNMNCEEVCQRLGSNYGIAGRGGFHCAGLAHKTIGTYDTGAVRLSVGPYNTKQDIKQAIRAIYQIQKL